MNSFSKSITSRWLIRGEIVKRLQSSTSSDIKIPNRIERGPTDILKALESTISRDYTAAHYKFHDDPYLIPTSTRMQRTYALARESGKKAAMWVLKEHADLFQHKVADPIIEAFIPKVVYKDKNDVSEEILLNIIHSGQVEEALNVYNLLEEQVSDETKQALLEMLCYCNSKSLVSEELIEERWYTITNRRPVNNWRDHPDLTKLFEYLKNQGGEKAAKAYCALISGTAKHYNVNKSWKLFEECKDQNIPLSVNVYNYILQLIPAVKDNTSKIQESVEEILNLMAAQGLKPNTRTWNACLSVVWYIKHSSQMQEYVRSVFAEFNQLNIQPSLATYYHVLVAFYAQDNSSNSVILTILNEIEKKNFTVIEDLDLFFFVTAMETAERLQDREVADKIHNLLLSGDNYKFIGDNNKESIYYRHYVLTVLKTQPFEEFMQFYSKLVPNIYIPEPKVMKEILYCLEINLPEISREYLPRIWSHMIIFNCLDREDLTSAVFNLMCTHCAPESPESPLHQIYKEAALAMWKHIQNEIGKKFSRLVLNAVTCGDIALLLLRGDEFGQAIEVINFMVKEVGKLNGQMKIESMNELFDACILQGHTIGALLMVQYAIDNGFEEASAMGQRIYKNIPLNQNQEQKLTSLVGSAILQMEIPEEDDKKAQDKVKAK